MYAISGVAIYSYLNIILEMLILKIIELIGPTHTLRVLLEGIWTTETTTLYILPKNLLHVWFFGPPLVGYSLKTFGFEFILCILVIQKSI